MAFSPIICFNFYFILSNLYPPQSGVWTPDPKIQRHMLYSLTQSCAPPDSLNVFNMEQCTEEYIVNSIYWHMGWVTLIGKRNISWIWNCREYAFPGLETWKRQAFSLQQTVCSNTFFFLIDEKNETQGRQETWHSHMPSCWLNIQWDLDILIFHPEAVRWRIKSTDFNVRETWVDCLV